MLLTSKYRERLFIKQLVFCDSVMKKVFLFQNIVGAEYTANACIHLQNIAGAAAPTAPMVPTPTADRVADRSSCIQSVIRKFCLQVGTRFSLFIFGGIPKKYSRN